jgi:hypothetical protein
MPNWALFMKTLGIARDEEEGGDKGWAAADSRIGLT